jgi:hypothetical protein
MGDARVHFCDSDYNTIAAAGVLIERQASLGRGGRIGCLFIPSLPTEESQVRFQEGPGTGR